MANWPTIKIFKKPAGTVRMKTVVEFPDRSLLAEEAAEWLIRLDSDEPPDAKVLDELHQWMARSPAHRAELENLASLWQRLNVLTELAVPLGRPGHSARADRRSSNARSSLRFSGYAVRLGVVGGLVLVCTLTLLQVLPIQNPAPPGNGLYATAVGQQSSTRLGDGSEIVLNTNSQIRIEYGDEYRRIYLLQGEALFTVAKDTRRPFRVYAGTGRIQALGTAFSVYLDEGKVNITVAEGSVSLASIRRTLAAPPEHSEVREEVHPRTPVPTDDEDLHTIGTMVAGQVATLPGPAPGPAGGDIGELEIIRPVAPDELAQRLSWREGVLMFRGDTLEEVVREVSRYTTVSIEVPDPDVRTMRIGGRLPVGETAAMLAALETNFSLEVTRVGRDRVVLTAAE